MHELPMVEGLIALLERTAGQNKLQRITLVELRIGELSDLVDECIQVYFDMAGEGTVCEGAKLVFTHERAMLRCPVCGKAFRHEKSFQCPSCGADAVLVRGTGSGFYVERIEGEDAAPRVPQDHGGTKMSKDLKDYVRTIPDFPEPGIMFRDITTVANDADGLRLAIDSMQDLVRDLDFDVVVGAESRGFIFGTPIAYNLHKPFALIRKKGKLPWETVSVDYTLEYGTSTLEMHKDAVKPGQKVLIVDDLMATGGTAKAMIQLVEKLGGKVAGVLVLMELQGLHGAEAIAPCPVFSAIKYEGK